MKKMLRKPIAAFGIFLTTFSLFFIGCQKKKFYEEPQELKKPETTAITGGTPIQISDRPFQVLVRGEFDASGTYIPGNVSGGGTVLSPNWVVTAAHLFDGNYQNPTSTQIWVGSTNVLDNFTGSVAYVDSIIIHPNYNGNYKDFYDIALLHLSTPLTYTNSCSPILYVYPHELSYQDIGSIVTASGWGRNWNTESWNQLRSTTMKVISKNSPLIPAIGFPRSDKAIYAFTDDSSPKAIGSGDSGGPLTANIPGLGEVLVGIASFSGPDATPYPSAFTKVSDYFSWIQAVTGVVRPSIVGPDAFCSSGVYTINNLPNGAAVSWSLTNSPIHGSLSNSNGATTNVTKSDPYSHFGQETLTATISIGVSTWVVSKTIVLGRPPTMYDMFCYLPLNPSQYQISSFYIFRAQYSGIPPSQYKWSYRIHGTTNETVIGSTGEDGAFIFEDPGTYDIVARPADPCGIIGGYEVVKTIDVVGY